jgi:hypothetical protein
VDPSRTPPAEGSRLQSPLTKALHDGISLFNERQFFEAHEVWEDAWRTAAGTDRLLLHGLIQVAAGFHKIQCGQPAGAVALLDKAMEKLAAVPPGMSKSLGLAPWFSSVEAQKAHARRMVESGSTDHDPAAFPPLPAPPASLWSGAIHTHIEIAADARRVWEVLTDFTAYPSWNPFLIEVRGEARPGTRLAVRTQFPSGRLMNFRPLILRADPRRELRWWGRSRVPGLFEGEHVLNIAPLEPDRVRFSQREMFRGLLVPILRRTHLDPTRNGFEIMNAALKARVERTP